MRYIHSLISQQLNILGKKYNLHTFRVSRKYTLTSPRTTNILLLYDILIRVEKHSYLSM